MHWTSHRPSPMRLRLLLAPVCAALLGSCAYQGTIVQKDATPLPFEHSYGLDGSYAFLLRDSTGAVRRQVVTAEVYNEYSVGEYFNDLQPRRASDGKTFDGKTVMTAMMSKVTTRRSLATRKPDQKVKIAKTAKAKKSEVKVAKHSRSAAKPQSPRVLPQPPCRRRAKCFLLRSRSSCHRRFCGRVRCGTTSSPTSASRAAAKHRADAPAVRREPRLRFRVIALRQFRDEPCRAIT